MKLIKANKRTIRELKKIRECLYSFCKLIAMKQGYISVDSFLEQQSKYEKNYAEKLKAFADVIQFCEETRRMGKN